MSEQVETPEVAVWFMGPTNGPGYVLLRSDKPGRYDRAEGDGSWHRPPNFPWSSMDRKWSAVYKPQGTTAMDYCTVNDHNAWSVLSVADYTQDSRPNVMVAFAVQCADVPEDEMCKLAENHYPTIWKRLGVRAGND